MMIIKRRARKPLANIQSTVGYAPSGVGGVVDPDTHRADVPCVIISAGDFRICMTVKELDRLHAEYKMLAAAEV